MYVVATAGHVDHGKSTLVQALTGMQPDRWEEERRRGLTIDLGFVWATLPSGRDVAFVDVPGHERFLANMLSGLAPVDVVVFVVAADEGWQQQSTDHLDACAALGVRHGLVVLTRADRADAAQIAATRARVRERLAPTELSDAPVVTVSAVTGEGLDEMRAALDEVLAGLPATDPEARVRVWLDRSFTIKGAGTVVTGTLSAGTLSEGDRLTLAARDGAREVAVRGLQSEEVQEGRVGPTNRVAVNLRGEDAAGIHRGDALLTPEAWWLTDTVDVGVVTGEGLADAPREVAAHIGTAELNAGLRRLDDAHARLTLPRKFPLTRGDRFVLRAPGDHAVLAGVEVLDVDPPELVGRGASRRRAAELPGLNLAAEVARRGAVRAATLETMGWRVPGEAPAGVERRDGWLIDSGSLKRWAKELGEAVAGADRMNPGVARKAAVDLLGLPAGGLLDAAVAAAGLALRDGRVVDPARTVDLGAAEESVAQIEEWLGEEPFRAPEADELADLRLGARELAAAEKAGRIIRIGPDRSVILLPDAPARAAEALAGLPEPFTLSQARKALDTTRRIAVPLLEHMDTLGLTRREGNARRLR